MLIEHIDLHLRNTIEQLNLPIYIHLQDNICVPPPNLALGDTLMLLGLIRNHGKPVNIFINPSPQVKNLLEAHPLINSIEPGQESPFQLNILNIPRSGRRNTWQALTVYPMKIPVLPVDKIKANPILAHSLYYKLHRTEDWPSIFVSESYASLSGLLSKRKPNLVIFPLNPGRNDSPWQDTGWWVNLVKNLRKNYTVIGVGANNYGELENLLDVYLYANTAESKLTDIAWLIKKSHGFIGRDGGISHLASGVNRNLVIIWDSMASYRFWASSRGHHIVLSNPYAFRYPQTMRMEIKDLRENYNNIEYPDKQGQIIKHKLPSETDEAYINGAETAFGSFEQLKTFIYGQLEVEQDNISVLKWFRNPDLRKKIHEQTLALVLQAINAQLVPETSWVVTD